MPGHSRLRVSYLQYNFSFGQFYAPQSASFTQLSLSTIRTGSKIPYGFACRTAVATIERLCMQMRLTTTVGNGLNSTLTLCLPLFSRFCGTLGLCPYESYGPDYTLLALFVFVSLVLLAACLGSHAFCALLHTFVLFLLPIFGYKLEAHSGCDMFSLAVTQTTKNQHKHMIIISGQRTVNDL